MEITGNVINLFEDFIRIQTINKQQLIDIFFTKSKREAINYRYEPFMVTVIEVEVQTVEYENHKFAKLWFKNTVFPNLPNLEDFNCEIGIKRREKMKMLYKLDRKNL